MHLALFSKGRPERDQPKRHCGPRGAAAPVISISVAALGHSSTDSDSQQELHAVGSALHTLLGEHGLPATWGLSESFASSFVGQLGAGQRTFLSNEIALGLELPASHEDGRRTAVADSLARCVDYATTCGVHITTLFADESLLFGHYDLLVKRGITAVRNTVATGSGRGGFQRVPRQLRYGLWGFPVAHTLPGDGLVSGVESRLASGASVGGPARSALVFHVSVELARLTAGDRHAWRVLQKSLRRLARLRTEQGVRIESLRSLTARLSAVPAAIPQRSILRRAA